MSEPQDEWNIFDAKCRDSFLKWHLINKFNIIKPLKF